MIISKSDILAFTKEIKDYFDNKKLSMRNNPYLCALKKTHCNANLVDK